MNRSSAHIFLFMALLAGCATPPTPKSRRAEVAAPSPTPSPEVPIEKPKLMAVLLSLHAEGDPKPLLETLEENPQLKITIVFPPAYFQSSDRLESSQRFSALQASKQIEIALSLDNEPNLPLLADLKTAGQPAQKWGVNFAWPEDAAAQTARGAGRYRKRWGQPASGFSPPYGAVNETVMQVLRRFRLSWVLTRAEEPWGVRFFGGTALLVPRAVSVSPDLPVPTAAKDAAKGALALPFSHIDARNWPTPEFERQFLKELATLSANATTPLGTATEFVSGLRNEYELPSGADPFANDYSAWVQSPLQKRAWLALSEARQVIENYKNSGRADLNRLDAAVEEMCVAESGPFLLSLAEDPNAAAFGQRNFLATVANIYRLAGQPVPTNLNTWFADRSLHRGQVRSVDADRPFFIEEHHRLTWNDPRSDDNGHGDITYPSGPYKRGAFDLRDLTLSWTDTDVTFKVAVEHLSPVGSVPLVPLVDIYIDVNRLSGAGSSVLLSRRGQAEVERDAAWEYAVAITPKTSALYQGLPAGEQRLLSTRVSAVSGASFSVTFSRRALRGDPRQWRLTVAAGAAETPGRDEAPLPIAVQGAATSKTFGGAMGPRMPPAYVDVLAPAGDTQASRLKTFASGTVLLPYVEAE